jgi:hypothetical protein
MPMRLIDTKRRGPVRRYVAWLDTSKTLGDGTTPDPDWTVTIEFPAVPPAGLGVAAYTQDITERAKVFARAALAERLAREVQANTGLAVEGTDFV